MLAHYAVSTPLHITTKIVAQGLIPQIKGSNFYSINNVTCEVDQKEDHQALR